MELQHIKSFPKDGKVLVTNFKKGDVAQLLFDKMKTKLLNSGSFIITGPFVKYPWQKAFDFKNQVINYLGKPATLYKELTEEIVKSEISNIDLIVGDYEDVDVAFRTVKKWSTKINAEGRGVFKLPPLLHSEFVSKVTHYNPKIKVVSEGNFSYITFNSVKKVEGKKVIRERSTEMT